jgi:mono/diheme cytochrome c family protein
MMFMRVLVFTLLMILLSACSFTLAADVTPPPGYQEPAVMEAPVKATTGPMYPLVPPDPGQGKVIYTEKCEPCHGVTGLGNGPQAEQLPNPVIPIGTREVARQATPAEWYSVVTQGNLERFMPPFSSLTERQRWDVVAYTFSLSTASQAIAQGETLYQANCAGCHGAAGHGDGPSAAGMALPDFSDQEYMAGKAASDFFQAISEGAGSMPAFGDLLSEDERWALTDYLRSLSFESSADLSQAQATPLVEATPEIVEEPTEPITETAGLDEAPGIGTVGGFVMNASGGDIPTGLEVMLHGFDQMQIMVTDTTRLEEDGSYLFTDIEMPVGRVFLTTVDFQGTTYGSDVATFEGEDNSIELPIQVYETTTDTSELFADRLHMFFEQLDEQTMRVVELYIVSNPGNKTVVAAEQGGPVLEFNLPAQAANIEFQDDSLGGRYVKTDSGFGDTLPIRPGMGNYQVLFSYEMPFQRKMELMHPVNIPVDAVVILVPEDSVKIKGELIQDAGVREMQGVTYHMYNGSSLNANDELRLDLSTRPVASANLSSSSGVVIGVAAFGVALIVTGIWLYRRMAVSDNGMDEEEPDEAQERTSPSVDAIMDAILALDDLYREGQLPDEAYHKRRAELKAELRNLMEDQSA